MIYPRNVLFRSHIFHKYIFLFSKTMFIRSIDKPKAGSISKTEFLLQQQPYSKFFVLDFEATCDNGLHLLKPQEIIEFPCIFVELNKITGCFEVKSFFHSYVRPKVHTKLSDYCSQLTGITQDMVDNSKLFDDVFHDFCKFYKHHTVNDEDKSIIVTSGNWDLGNIFLVQCELFPETIQVPDFMYSWINIKKLFGLTTGRYPYGIRNMLQSSDLKQFGNIHSGIDDCMNIITIMNYLAQKGCIFNRTN